MILCTWSVYPGRKYVKNSISFDTLRRCINKRIIMHRPRCSTVHLHGRLHRLPLGPSRVPLFLFSKFGWTTLVSRLAKEKILNTIWAAARYYLHTQAWIFSKKKLAQRVGFNSFSAENIHSPRTERMRGR